MSVISGGNTFHTWEFGSDPVPGEPEEAASERARSGNGCRPPCTQPPLGPCVLPMALEVSVVENAAKWIFMANPKERISKQMPRCLEQALDICSGTWTTVNTQLLLCGWTLPEMGA